MSKLELSRISSEYAREFRDMRYPQCKTRKISSDFYYQEIKSAHIAGILSCVEAMVEQNEKCAYLSVDEMFGDFHNIAVSTWNEYAEKLCGKVFKETTITRFIESGGVLGEPIR